jgi:hypothetical protein
MRLRPSHPFVGIWEVVDSPIHKTSVVYGIKTVSGDLVVSGWDEADGEPLKVSGVKWDGETLHFITLFPPTRHKARHVMRLVGRGRATHDVDSFHEIWKKRSPKSKADPSATQARK